MAATMGAEEARQAGLMELQVAGRAVVWLEVVALVTVVVMWVAVVQGVGEREKVVAEEATAEGRWGVVAAMMGQQMANGEASSGLAKMERVPKVVDSAAAVATGVAAQVAEATAVAGSEVVHKVE